MRLVLSVALGFALAFSVFAAPNLYAQAPPRRKVSLEDIWSNGTFRPRGVQDFRWMRDDNYYTDLVGGFILRFSVSDSTAKPDTLVRTAQLRNPANGLPIGVQDYQFSEDEKWVILRSKIEPLYRHSSSAVVFLYHPQRDTLILLGGGKKIFLPEISPDGRKVAYVLDNNLIIHDLVSGVVTPLTRDGEWNRVINGRTDWVYEEEFAIWKAFFWSPDSRRLAYYRFDESNVREFQMEMIGGLYPEWFSFKYPKAGEDNALVSLHIADVEANTTRLVARGDSTRYYFPQAGWVKRSGQFWFLAMNRHQNRMEVVTCNPADASLRTVLVESSQTYIEQPNEHTVTFLETSDQFVFQSEQSGYNHLYLYNLQGQQVRALTMGNWDVTEFYGVDERNQVLYYQAAEESPLRRGVYSVSLDGRRKKLLTEQVGWNEAAFSRGYSYYVHSFSTAATAPVHRLINTKLNKQARMLQQNSALSQVLGQYELSRKEFFQLPNADGTLLNAFIIRPSQFDSTRRYPVLMYVYGGPGSQTVMDKFDPANTMWFQHLADQGYVIVSVDNRGTGARGANFKKCTYLQLGKLEAEDQIAAARWLSTQRWVDAQRIGIFGWSFGGYMSCLCLLWGADVFKAAISVAPVTNWRFYDTIYTERYLRTPQENASGYDDNSPNRHTQKLKGRLLLVHGMADDNVHLQNGTELTNALVANNKQFQQFFYPNRNHGIYGGNTRLHLFGMMTNFVKENL
jgi:dipeptidyl-peptidase-4